MGEAFLRTFHRLPFWFYVPQTTALKLQTFKMWVFPWHKAHDEIRIWPVNLSHSAEDDYRIKCSFYGWQKTFLIGCWWAGQLRRQKFEWKPSACFSRLKNKKSTTPSNTCNVRTNLLWTSPLCLVTSFWMLLSTGVTGVTGVTGGGGGGGT